MRVTDTSATCIDNIFSNVNPDSPRVVVSDTSDHFGVFSRHAIPLGNSCRLMNEFSWHYVNKTILLRYKRVLSQMNWDNILSIASNNEERFNLFYQIIQSELEKHCQRKKDGVGQPQRSHGLLETF